MTWQNILDELKKAALTVSNQGPASDSILGVKYLTLQHSADHWEELHAPVHAIFGWGQEGGLLSSKSSQADFLLIHDFLNTFAHVKQDVGEGSCLSAMVPRMHTALELCRKAPQSPAHDLDPPSHKSCENQSEPLHMHANPSRTTSAPSPARPDAQPKEYIEISEGSDKADEESTDGSEGHDTDDEHKYDRHLQRCPWVTGSRSKSKTKKEYIPMKSITSFFTSSGKKSSGTVEQKSPQSIPPPTVVQADGANIDTSMVCPGQADGAYAVLAKNAVAGDVGGVGSITSRVEMAKVLFPYKYGVSAQEEMTDDISASPSQRNTHTSITKFSQEELAILGQELLSHRRWFVENGCDAGSRIIRSATCTRRFVPGGKVMCEQCCALDKDKSLQRQLRRASKRDKADAQLSETDWNKVEKRRVTNTSLILVQTRSAQLKEYLKDPWVHRVYQLLENDEYGRVFLELFKHANEHGLFVKIAEALADKVGQTHSDNPNAKYGACYDSEVMNFFIAMRGYGSQSVVQYGLLSQLTTLHTVATKVSQLFLLWTVQWFVIIRAAHRTVYGRRPYTYGRDMVDSEPVHHEVNGMVQSIIRTYTVVYGTYGMKTNHKRAKRSLAFTSINVLTVSGLRLAHRSETVSRPPEKIRSTATADPHQ
ncbi:hypothetical protein EDB19DRAFT_2029789 [Suillus lakei]|nr:hypothetical protein EDB19DRAFT_2029789 [Suillus lakei]